MHMSAQILDKIHTRWLLFIFPQRSSLANAAKFMCQQQTLELWDGSTTSENIYKSNVQNNSFSALTEVGAGYT